MSNTLSTAQINSLQGYYAEHADEIVTEIFEQMSDAGLVEYQFGDQLELYDSETTVEAQSYQSSFTPKGSVSIGSHPVQMRLIKSDLVMTPRDFHNIEKLMNREPGLRRGDDPYNYPMERFVLSNIVSKIMENIEVSAKWNGLFNGPIAGLPNNTWDTVDGFRKVIDDLVIAGTVPRFAMPQLTASNAYSELVKLIEYVNDTPTKVNRGGILFVSQATLRNIKAEYLTDYGAGFGLADVQAIRGDRSSMPFPDFPGVTVQAEAGLSGSQVLFARPRRLVQGHRGTPSLIIEREKRQLNVLWDWSIAYGVHAPKYDLIPNVWF